MTLENNSRKSVGILFGAAMTPQNFDRLGITQLSKHFEIHLFDCRELLGRSTDESSISVLEFGNHFEVTSIVSLKLTLSRLRPDFVLDAIGYCPLTESIIKVLRETQSVYIHWSPAPIVKATILSRIHFLIYRIQQELSLKKIESSTDLNSQNAVMRARSNLIQRLFRVISEKFRVRKLSISDAEIALLSGREGLNKYTKKAGGIIWSSGYDYFSFKSALFTINERESDFPKTPYILFIDDNLPNASDWALLRQKPPVSEEAYYEALKDIFLKIESIYGLQVVIAGHPSSFQEPLISSKMGGRGVYFNQTASLAIKSSVVLAHASTAISFAVLAKRPLVFLTSKELTKSMTGMIIKSASQRLGAPLVFIDNSNAQIPPILSLEIKPKKYAKYIQNYIRSNECSEEEPWQSLISYILSI